MIDCQVSLIGGVFERPRVELFVRFVGQLPGEPLLFSNLGKEGGQLRVGNMGLLVNGLFGQGSDGKQVDESESHTLFSGLSVGVRRSRCGSQGSGGG